jgi:hypothetical protein
VATVSVKAVASSRLGRRAPLSLRRDVLGVFGDDHPQARSLKRRLDLAQHAPVVRIAIVTIKGAFDEHVQEDLDSASLIYENECGTWIHCMDVITVDRPHLLTLDQDDFNGPRDPEGHEVSDEERELFALGRDLGANIVGYYVGGSNAPGSIGPGVVGAAAHPPGRRGFWVNPFHENRTRWSFAHELTHVVGSNSHICDTDNLMIGETLHRPCDAVGTQSITDPPPDLTDAQCRRILNDPDMERPA